MVCHFPLQHTPASDLRAQELRGQCGVPGGGAVAGPQARCTPSQTWSFRFLSSKCRFQLAVPPACGFSRDWNRLCFAALEGATFPFPLLLSAPASFFKQAESCCFSHFRERGERRETCVRAVRLPGWEQARDQMPLTPRLWPHQMPLQSSTASSVSLLR